MTRSNTRTVVHLDDDPAMLSIVKAKLSKSGYEVVSTSDPSQIVKTVLTSNAQVVLLDIDLPNTNGLDILKQIKADNGGIQVIMLTGVVSMMTLLQSMRWGAEACVFKPIKDFDELTDAVGHAFGKLERWWDALDELRRLKNEEGLSSAKLT